MRTDTGSDNQTDGGTGQRQAGVRSWLVALASVGICFGTAALIAILA